MLDIPVISSKVSNSVMQFDILLSLLLNSLFGTSFDNKWNHGILKNTAAFVTFHPSLLKGRLFLFLESERHSLKNTAAFVTFHPSLLKGRLFLFLESERHSLKNTAAFVTFHPSLLKGRLSLFLESERHSLVKSFVHVQSSSAAASKTAGVFETIKLQFRAVWCSTEF